MSKIKCSNTIRPSKDQYYLNIAKQVAERSTCFRVKGGAIIVRGDQIVSAGYVGAPRKTKDCFERGNCLRDEMNIPHGKNYEICRSVHCEQNAIINAARSGVSLYDGDIYIYIARFKTGEKIDSFPCFICKKMIINAGLKRAVCSTKEGKIKVFEIEEWVKEWQEKDLLDDKDQYGADQNKKNE
jgi:dCMP deaminase